jgi:nicotinamidase-related amidase
MLTRRSLLFTPAAAAARLWAAPTAIRLQLRSRVELYRGSGAWKEITVEEEVDPKASALILCDMWDNHWCKGAVTRVNQMVGRFNPVLREARKAGIQVIHAPSETMDFYRDAPQRKAAIELPKTAAPEPLSIADPALPVDSSAGGCDTPDKFFKAWTRQHPAIEIAPQDFISDKGNEVYSLLKLRGTRHLFVAGVHTNMCILNRTFAIKQMTRWGVRCILLRDLTDAMYDPQAAPHVSHEQGTALVIEHIEKYWCPTVLSTQFTSALAQSATKRS